MVARILSADRPGNRVLAVLLLAIVAGLALAPILFPGTRALNVAAKVCVFASGLLGTVGGMLEVFDSMAARGSADARSMASGISEAMICTLTGLAVSITGLYPAYYFRRRVRHETELIGDRFKY